MSRPQGHGTVGRNMSLKNPVTPPGIDPGTLRLVAQRLNHYATPGPRHFVIHCHYSSIANCQEKCPATFWETFGHFRGNFKFFTIFRETLKLFCWTLGFCVTLLVKHCFIGVILELRNLTLLLQFKANLEWGSELIPDIPLQHFHSRWFHWMSCCLQHNCITDVLCSVR